MPDKIYRSDLAGFAWAAATELLQRNVLFAEVLERKLLVAYNCIREKRITDAHGLTIVDEIEGIIFCEVTEFRKFIRFDPFEKEMLLYADSFDNAVTYKDSTIFINVERLPKRNDDIILHHIMVTEAIDY